MAALEMLDRYTYEDYKKWDGRWELIDGVAYAMAPAPYLKHQKIVLYIAKEMDENLECDECEVYVSPVDWVIDERTVVQPDVVLTCEEIEEDAKFLRKTPQIVVEVLSLATALKDLTTKFNLYEKEGVPYYVIINPKTEEVEVFGLQNGKYVMKEKFEGKGRCRFSWDDCATTIDFTKVFT